MGRDYILANLAADLDNDSIARAACLSPFYFNRLFKQAFGQSPHKFLTEQRLKRAANLLGKGGTIEEACLAAGFRSITTFCNLFSRTFGLTPGGWRAAQISQE
jgi:AraC-like DNA-binding protein